MRLRSGKQATSAELSVLNNPSAAALLAQTSSPSLDLMDFVPETQDLVLPPATTHVELPRQTPTFKDKLMAATSAPLPEADEDLCIRGEDIRLGMNGNIPTIDFADHILEALNRRMGFSVVIKLLGRTIGYRHLRTRLQSLWSPSGHFQLVDLDANCFLVKFRLEADFHHALTSGPWVIFGHCLSVQPWTPSFNPHHHSVSRIVTWVRLPNLPARYYQHDVITSIGNVFGEVIKIDYITASGDRGRFARLAIALDLTKPLTPKIQVDGETIYIEYEGLPSICFACGRYGHSQEVCPENQVTTGQEPRLLPARESHVSDAREQSVFGE